MTTIERELDSFQQYVQSRIAATPDRESLDSLYDEWRSGHPSAEDIAAVREGVAAFQNGDRGRPAGEWSAGVRAKYFGEAT